MTNTSPCARVDDGDRGAGREALAQQRLLRRGVASGMAVSVATSCERKSRIAALPSASADGADPGAVAKSAASVVARRRGHLAREVDACANALEGLAQHGELPLALGRQSDVPKLGSAHSPGSCLRPRVLDAVGRRLENCDRVGSPELGIGLGLGEPRDDRLAWQRVAHKDDAAVVARYAMSAVGDGAQRSA